MNTKFGMGLSDIPANITSILPFFLTLELPFSIQRNETLILDIPLFNNINQNQDVVFSIPKTGKFNGVDLATYGWTGE